MKCGDDRRVQFAQQRQDMAAGRPAEDSKFVLERDHVHVAGVQEIGGAPVRVQFPLLNFEAHHVGILVASLHVVDRDSEASALRMPRRHRSQQVGRKRGDAAFARRVITEKRDLSNSCRNFCDWFTQHC